MMHVLLLLAAPEAPADRPPEVSIVQVGAPITETPAPIFGEAIAETDLATATAREDIAQIATAQQTARVSNNSVNGTSRTGEVAIDGQAFQNFSGLGIVNANSGNNVGINAAINVNVTITPR